MNQAFNYEKIARRMGAARLKERLARQAKDARRLARRLSRKADQGEPLNLHGLIELGLKLTGLFEKGQQNSRNLQVEHHTFRLPHLPPAFQGFRILHLSDMHFECNLQLTDILIRKIRELEYDVCVVTGDFRFETSRPFKKSMQEMARVREAIPAPVYAVLGNHDCIEMFDDFERMDLPLLLNESLPIERDGACLYLGGIDDPHYHKSADVEQAADCIPDDAVSILLSHSSEVYREAYACGFDVLLCGHTHGGQICLPGGIPVLNRARAPWSFLKGAWHYKSLQGYTSRGSGTGGVDVRYNCLPEITIHTLSRDGAG